MRILFVGDVHGNGDRWLDTVVPLAGGLTADGVIQVGDFGFWPHSTAFSAAVADTPMPVWFCDGNHEHHPYLATQAADARERLGLAPVEPVPLMGSLGYLPRGCRMEFDGVRVAVLGGAHSGSSGPNRGVRCSSRASTAAAGPWASTR